MVLMNKYGSLMASLLVIGVFTLSGLVGFSVVEHDGGFVEGTSTALANMTDDITTLLTDIIPVFIILGVFGAVIAYVGKLSKGFGGN